ncbi:MAG: DUF2851 family protein [Alistipes sp.]
MATEGEARMLNRLLAGADRYDCGNYLLELPNLNRSEILLDLAYDRLRRKFNAVHDLFMEADENWNQTFYLMFFRTLGDKRNQTAYLTLARRVSYAMVLRERASLHNVEALMFGCSGLLELYEHDIYTLDLQRDFEYLAAKYDIEPMDAAEWDLTRIQPANHPVLRLAQAAAFMVCHEFVMDRVLNCRATDDVANLFRVEASTYWSTHYLPASTSSDIPKRIGAFKSNMLGINLVAIMQYAYGSYIASDVLRDRAVTLLERLEAEDNIYIRHWQAQGLMPRNAFESQALLQLATEYCIEKRCEECPVGRRRIKCATED